MKKNKLIICPWLTLGIEKKFSSSWKSEWDKKTKHMEYQLLFKVATKSTTLAAKVCEPPRFKERKSPQLKINRRIDKIYPC